MKFSQTVQAITYNKILPSVVDLVNDSNILTARVTGTLLKKWQGTTVSQPVRVKNSTTGKSFDGLDEFNTAVQDNTRSLTWYPTGFAQTCSISGIEKAVNGTSDRKALSLVSNALEDAKNSALEALGSQFYGYGVGKDFDGLGNITDNGTATSSYAGLTRADYPMINGNVVAAAGGTLSLDLMASTYDTISATGSDQDNPTIVYTTPAVWSLFEKLLDSKISVQYNPVAINGYSRVSGKTPVGVSVPASELNGAAGMVSLSFRGKPVVPDQKAPDGDMFFVNEHYMGFYRLEHPDLQSVKSTNEVSEGPYKNVPQPGFLQLRDFMSPVNQLGEIGALIALGNLVHRHPRRNGRITGITKI